jgi:hypothetical protein
MGKTLKHDVFSYFFRCCWVAVYVHKMIFHFMLSLRFREANVFATVSSPVSFTLVINYR